MATQAAPLRRTADLSFALNKLHQVALLATDLDRSVTFYRDVLGLHYMDRYDPPGLAFFNLGSGVRLILSATSSKATLYFLVDDIESAFRVLAQRGVSFLHKPSMIHRDDEGRLGKKGTEEWMAFFKDPSDNVLALVARR
jgi:methylmalonyl-CoA/ethylmalonyl-CoA epimerase